MKKKSNVWQCTCCGNVFRWAERAVKDGMNVSPCCKRGIRMVSMENDMDEKYLDYLQEQFSFYPRFKDHHYR